MNFLFPKFDWRLLPRMFGIAFLGAIIAGSYGMVHDQVTYLISPEYFTKLKFEQFAHADLGFPKPVFAGIVGFLGTWWIGFIAGWFFARITLPVLSFKAAFRQCMRGFFVMISFAIVSGFIGYSIGFCFPSNGVFWQEIIREYRIVDESAFIHVGIIHYAGYIGGVLGLITALAIIFRFRKSFETNQS